MVLYLFCFTLLANRLVQRHNRAPILLLSRLLSPVCSRHFNHTPNLQVLLLDNRVDSHPGNLFHILQRSPVGSRLCTLAEFPQNNQRDNQVDSHL